MQAKKPMKTKSKIASLRNKIDQIDKKILKLLSQRKDIVHIIGEIKSLNKIEITDKKRENEIIDRGESPFEKEIMRKIIKESKKLQKKGKSK